MMMKMITVVCQIPLKGDHPPPEEKPEVDLPRDSPARQPHPSKDFFRDIFNIFQYFLEFSGFLWEQSKKLLLNTFFDWFG